MQINIIEKSGVSICVLKGDVDINSSPELKNILRSSLKVNQERS